MGGKKGRGVVRITPAFVVIVAGVLAACGSGPSELELDHQLDRLLDRTRQVAEEAAHFDHDQTLRDIGIDRANGTVYRLDEHLDQALHQSATDVLNGDEDLYSTIDLGAAAELAEGLVAYPVDLPIADASSLELQIVSPFGGHLEVELQGDRPGEAVTIELRTVGDGISHAYRLELGDTVASWTSDRIVGMRVRNPKLHDVGPVEIQSARFLPSSAAFADRPFGVTHRRESGETRKSIFQWSPSILRFTFQTEGSFAAELDLGASVLLADGEVQVQVVLQTDEGSRPLLSATLDRGNGWTDWRLPLAVLDGENVTIELRVASDQPNVVFWSNPAVVIPRERQFNVIVVLEDALRADHLSCYGYHRPTTPIKDAFANRGVRFANCYAQATKTRFSCPSFMTSLYPTATGVEGIWHRHPSLDEGYITLAEVLRRRGFVTVSMHQNPNAGSPAGLHQGFSYLFENIPGRADELYTDGPVQWIEEHRDRNFFLYLHLADPHEPYDPPEGYQKWFEEVESGAITGARGEPLDRHNPLWLQEARRALYDGEIRFNDRWFDVFLKRLEELALADDTLVIFMSDHGEHLGEHGRWSHNPPGYAQVLHTPLIMVYPRRLPSKLVVDDVVQNLDIMPTVLELAGVDDGPLLLQGDSLVPLMTNGAFKGWNRSLGYSEEALLKKSRHDPRPYGSVFFDRWHVLDSLYAPMELYDRTADPTESRRIRPARWLRNRVPTFLSDMQRAELEIWQGVTGGRDNVVVLDAETVSMLKALGYLK
jgi:arylsulfatase